MNRIPLLAVGVTALVATAGGAYVLGSAGNSGTTIAAPAVTDAPSTTAAPTPETPTTIEVIVEELPFEDAPVVTTQAEVAQAVTQQPATITQAPTTTVTAAPATTAAEPTTTTSEVEVEAAVTTTEAPAPAPTTTEARVTTTTAAPTTTTAAPTTTTTLAPTTTAAPTTTTQAVARGWCVHAETNATIGTNVTRQWCLDREPAPFTYLWSSQFRPTGGTTTTTEVETRTCWSYTGTVFVVGEWVISQTDATADECRINDKTGFAIAPRWQNTRPAQIFEMRTCWTWNLIALEWRSSSAPVVESSCQNPLQTQQWSNSKPTWVPTTPTTVAPTTTTQAADYVCVLRIWRDPFNGFDNSSNVLLSTQDCTQNPDLSGLNCNGTAGPTAASYDCYRP